MFFWSPLMWILKLVLVPPRFARPGRKLHLAEPGDRGSNFAQMWKEQAVGIFSHAHSRANLVTRSCSPFKQSSSTPTRRARFTAYRVCVYQIRVCGEISYRDVNKAVCVREARFEKHDEIYESLLQTSRRELRSVITRSRFISSP
ncbi:hypothetical protein BKA64DRAFT_654295 [Cadophora sp. MPI-SDFR-AT-0126]|nr:hypothetical protein BKA64DRAFT_654295 [Leotiomycetes sp. MPI-SDFR-AT-0126]